MRPDLRPRSVAWHAVLLLIVAALGVPVTARPPVDANIGAGMVVLLVILMGLPWSAFYWGPDLAGAWTLNTPAAVTLTACFALLNLAVHAILVARTYAKQGGYHDRSAA